MLLWRCWNISASNATLGSALYCDPGPSTPTPHTHTHSPPTSTTSILTRCLNSPTSPHTLCSTPQMEVKMWRYTKMCEYHRSENFVYTCSVHWLKQCMSNFTRITFVAMATNKNILTVKISQSTVQEEAVEMSEKVRGSQFCGSFNSDELLKESWSISSVVTWFLWWTGHLLKVCYCWNGVRLDCLVWRVQCLFCGCSSCSGEFDLSHPYMYIVCHIICIGPCRWHW